MEYKKIKWEGRYLKVRHEHLIGFLNPDMSVALPAQYHAIHSFHENLALVSDGGLYGYIDTNLQIVVSPFYDDAEDFQDGMAIVRGSKRMGVLGIDGQPIVPLIYSSLKRLGPPGKMAAFRYSNSNRGIFDTLDLRRFIPKEEAPKMERALSQLKKLEEKYQLDEIKPSSEGILVGKYHRLYGLIDRSGIVQYEPVFEKVDYVQGLYRVVSGGNVGYMDGEGSWIWELRKE